MCCIAFPGTCLPASIQRRCCYLGIGECVFAQLTLSTSRVFQAFERMRFTALLSLTTNTLRMVLACILLLEMHHATARQWAGFSMFVSLAGCLVSLLTALRVFGLPALSFPLFRARFREGLLFATSSANTSVFNDIDKVLLAHFGQTAATGLYAMGYRAIEIATLPSALHSHGRVPPLLPGRRSILCSSSGARSAHPQENYIACRWLRRRFVDLCAARSRGGRKELCP